MRWQPMEDNTTPCDHTTSLDWSAIGRLVRRRTLESVSEHFQSLAAIQVRAVNVSVSHGEHRDVER